jgi:hypothetical protein
VAKAAGGETFCADGNLGEGTVATFILGHWFDTHLQAVRIGHRDGFVGLVCLALAVSMYLKLRGAIHV